MQKICNQMVNNQAVSDIFLNAVNMVSTMFSLISEYFLVSITFGVNAVMMYVFFFSQELGYLY